MNDVLNVIVSRRSVKSYKNKMVEKELIDKVIRAGMYAPSGKNLQSPIIIAITNKQVRDKLSKTLMETRGINIDPFYNAPVVIVVLANKNVSTYLYDGSCVMENMLIQAHSLGLGACWIHHAKQVFETEYGKEFLKGLGIDDNYEGIGHLILGYGEVINKNQIPRKDNYVYYVE